MLPKTPKRRQCLGGGGGGHSSGGKNGVWCLRKNFPRFGTYQQDFLLKKFQDESGWGPNAAEKFWEKWQSKEVCDMGKKFKTDYEGNKVAEVADLSRQCKEIRREELQGIQKDVATKVPCQDVGHDAANRPRPCSPGEVAGGHSGGRPEGCRRPPLGLSSN